MRTTWRLAVVTCAAAALLATAGAGPASAAEGASIVAVGWWTDVPVTSAPEGGIAAGQGAGRPSTVAALDLLITDEPPTTATLTLTEVDGVRSEDALLDVCPTPNEWEPVAGGPMEDAPRPECQRGAVPLERGDDGTWSADVASLLEPDETSVSLMVVPKQPATEEESPQGPFQVSFDPPKLNAPAPPATDDASETDASSSGSSSSSFTPPPSADVPAPATTPTSVATNAAAGSAETGEAVAPAAPLPAQNAVSTSEDRPWGQALFFVAVAAGAGIVAGIGRWQIRLRGASG